MSNLRQRIVTEIEEEKNETVLETFSRLTHWDDLPEWQRDNHFILSGYVRETMSFKKCFHSLGYIHNETGNIYSHLIPSVLALISCFIVIDRLVPRYSTTSYRDHLALVCFGLGCVMCLGMSGVYHCMKSHSSKVAAFGNKLDYLGIVILIHTSMTSLIYYGLYDHHHLRIYLWGLITILGGVCAVVSCFQKFRSPDWRPFRAGMFVAYGLSGVLPLLVGIQVYGYEECSRRIQLKWIIWEGILYISGSVLYAMRVPERFKPGKFDIWGHSHQIFHLLVVAAAVCHGIGLLNAYEYTHEVVMK